MYSSVDQQYRHLHYITFTLVTLIQSHLQRAVVHKDQNRADL